MAEAAFAAIEAVAEVPATAPAEVADGDDAGALSPDEAEAAARAEIAQLVSRLEPVELWVQVIGRTLEEARQSALEQLGVDAADAEIEVLAKGSRWLPGGVRIRARIRVTESSYS